MVISVSHLTDQVEIGGGGHAPILSGARGPAPPPSAGPRAPHPQTNPTPSSASDSYIAVRRGGYDDPFLFHPSTPDARARRLCYCFWLAPSLPKQARGLASSSRLAAEDPYT